ncbi:restriction endonuclease subunit S [Microbacterium sp. NPDC064584]|uniref:restriction endonuclease subunit S n=1 Tax=Microbacterium sp. NPDC064584 TaxID=3155817 RepID=UPI00344AD34C
MSELQLFAPNAMRAVEHRGWGVRPLKFLFRRGKELGEGSETLLSVYRDHGVVPKDSRDDNHNRASDDLTKYQLVRRGDLVVNKMKAWQGSVAVSSLDGIVSPAYFVYSPLAGIENRYAHYLLRTRDYFRFYSAISVGVRPGQWDLDPVAFDRMPVLLPSLREQRQIADYLDHETTEIDAFIADLNALTALANTRLVAQIDRLTAQPSSTDGSTDTVPLSRALPERVDYRGATPTKVDYGVQLLTARNVKMGWIDYETSREFVAEDDYAAVMSRGLPRRGDILFTMEAPLGNVALVDRERVALAQRLVKFRSAPDVDPQFLCFAMQSAAFQNQLRSFATGSTVLGIKASKLSQLRFNVPIMETQLRIAGLLREAQERSDLLGADIGAAIALVKERRAALITAAVTGQIDVAAKRTPVVDSIQSALEEAR